MSITAVNTPVLALMITNTQQSESSRRRAADISLRKHISCFFQGCLFCCPQKSWPLCEEIKVADPARLRFDAHCGYFNHLSPNMTSHCSGVLYRCIQSLQARFTLTLIPGGECPAGIGPA